MGCPARHRAGVGALWFSDVPPPAAPLAHKPPGSHLVPSFDPGEVRGTASPSPAVVHFNGTRQRETGRICTGRWAAAGTGPHPSPPTPRPGHLGLRRNLQHPPHRKRWPFAEYPPPLPCAHGFTYNMHVKHMGKHTGKHAHLHWRILSCPTREEVPKISHFQLFKEAPGDVVSRLGVTAPSPRAPERLGWSGCRGTGSEGGR